MLNLVALDNLYLLCCGFGVHNEFSFSCEFGNRWVDIISAPRGACDHAVGAGQCQDFGFDR